MDSFAVKMIAACTMLTAQRMAQGWNAEERDDLEIRAKVFIDALDRAGIPAEAYARLAALAGDVRSKALREGREPPNFSADLLVSCWDGPGGLKAQLGHESEAKRLPSAACPHCHGSGWRPHSPTDGRYPGVKRCTH